MRCCAQPGLLPCRTAGKTQTRIKPMAGRKLGLAGLRDSARKLLPSSSSSSFQEGRAGPRSKAEESRWLGPAWGRDSPLEQRRCSGPWFPQGESWKPSTGDEPVRLRENRGRGGGGVCLPRDPFFPVSEGFGLTRSQLAGHRPRGFPARRPPSQGEG